MTRTESPRLKKYECPKCATVTETLGVPEGHKCAKNRNKWVRGDLWRMVGLGVHSDPRDDRRD